MTRQASLKSARCLVALLLTISLLSACEGITDVNDAIRGPGYKGDRAVFDRTLEARDEGVPKQKRGSVQER